MEMLEATNRRNYALDFLKGIATIAIVFHHYQQVTGAMFAYNFWDGWFYWGYVVELFFLISGYVMGRYVKPIYEGKVNLKCWMAKRTLRCIPMMAIAAVVYEVTLYIHSRILGLDWFGIQPTIWGTVIASIGLQSNALFNNPCVNNPTWYISVLFLCYAVFYLTTALARRLKVRPGYLYAAVVLLGCGIATYGINCVFLDWQVARGYRGFFFGLILAMTIERLGGKPSKALVLSSIGVLAGFVLALVFDRTLLEDSLQNTMTFLVFPAILVLFATPVVQKIFAWKIWGKFGKASFDVYIWHSAMLVQMNLLLSITGKMLDYSKVRYMLLFTLAAEVVGILSHCCLEKPIARRVNGWLHRMEVRENASKNNMETLGGKP